MEKQNSSSNITEEASPTPSFSSCSSEFEFEFTISISPNNTNNKNHHFSPADEIFYKGQLLPLHHSPRITMLRTLLLSSDSSTSTTTTAAADDDDPRDSSASSSDDLQFFSFSDFDSSRPSSVSEDDKFINFNPNLKHPSDNFAPQIKKNKFLSFSILHFPSVFCTSKREKSDKKLLGFSAKDAIRKYFKKFKPLYEKIGTFSVISTEYAVFGVPIKTEEYEKNQYEKKLFTLRKNGGFSDSFTAKAGKCGASCPSSIKLSPNRSCKDSSVEEIQSDIQSAIAHCKDSNAS